MDDRKEKTVDHKNLMPIAIILALAIMVLLFNSQSSSLYHEDENIVNVSMENNTGVKISNHNLVENVTNITRDNDTFFKNWVVISFKTITESLNCVSKAGKNKNFTDMERCGKFLSENSNNSLRYIDEYNISSHMKIVSEEYKKALENYNIGGIKLETGARNRNTSQMGDAIKYIDMGTASVNNVTKILYPNGTLGTKAVKK